MMDPHLPPALRAEIERTWMPVRPLRPPSRRAASIVPWALVLLAAVPIVWGLRGDRDAIGLWRLWGASALQIALALVVATTALAESIPGRLSSWRDVVIRSMLGAGVFVTTTGLTFAASATFVPPALASRYFWICLSHPFVLGLPALLILSVLLGRGLASRPMTAGALAGLGAGLVSDASWRLYCHVSDPGHVLLAHAGAIVALTLLGGVVGATALGSRRQ